MKSGFVAVLGKTNVGKSTLINALLGKAYLITSPKPQTTRNRIRAILHLKDAQIILVDTPGLHNPVDLMGKYMIKVAKETLKDEVDLVLWMMEPEEFLNESGIKLWEEILKSYPEYKEKVIWIINKWDIVTNDQKEKIVEKKKNLSVPITIISALKKEGLDELILEIIKKLPEGPAYYPEDINIDRPAEFIASEIIREAVIFNTKQEVPYSVGVKVKDFEDKGKIIYIYAQIFMERDSQKGIIIGRRGAMIKEIGTYARKRLEEIFGKKVYLDLNVQVKKKWRKSPESIKYMGYNEADFKKL